MQYERGKYIINVSHFNISVRYKIVLRKADGRGIMIFLVLASYFLNCCL
jgi:hypothetical protein